MICGLEYTVLPLYLLDCIVILGNGAQAACSKERVLSRVKDEGGNSAVRHPDEVVKARAGAEDVGDDDRGKNFIAKRLRVFGLLGPLAVLWVAVVMLVIRLDRRFLLRGLKNRARP